MKEPPAAAQFQGFKLPEYTQIPNQIVDFLMPDLSGNEFKVLMYIARRTLGFHRATDAISLSQLTNGIRTKSGKVLNRGTGLSTATVKRSLNSLEKQGYIERKRVTDAARGHMPTEYTLRFQDAAGLLTAPVSQNETPPLAQNEPSPLSSKRAKPLAQIEPHKRNNIQKKQQQKDVVVAEGRGEKSVSAEVVTTLTKHGISKGVATNLSKAHQPDYIRNKVAYLEFLLSERPDAVKRPAAWLRSAIEKNYGKPDGFKSAEDLAREREEEAQRQAAEDARIQELKNSQQQANKEQAKREKAQNKRLRELQKQHGTTDEDKQMWESIVEQLQSLFTGATAQLLSHSYWLSENNELGLVAMRNNFSAQRVEKELSGAILRSLSGRGKKVKTLKIISLDEAEE